MSTPETSSGGQVEQGAVLSASTASSQVAERRRVLFVDDEEHLLSALRRMLHSERGRWDLIFASSGQEALQVIITQPVDVLVSDMRMPGMDGAELLAAVRQVSPSTARIILSGQADLDSVLAVLKSAQQFLAKPCDAATLIDAIDRALTVRQVLDDPALREMISGVASLPTLPSVYHELVAAMARPDVELSAVAAILASDVSTSAELLKLINSAFFGLPREVSSVEMATSLLGLDNIQALVLAGSVFQMGSGAARVVDVEGLRNQALRRVAISRAIGSREGWPAHERTVAVLAAMLRDVGELVLAEGRPASASALGQEIVAHEAAGDPQRRAELELASYGCTIPQASAYLLGLWGFAPVVVYTVAAQPATFTGPGATTFEQLLGFAHLRALSPLQHVSPGVGGTLDADRVLAWNTAAARR